MDLFDAKSAALIKQLQQQQAAYLLVGGYAVNIYGYSRGTGDMDTWIRPTTDNVLRYVYMQQVILNGQKLSQPFLAQQDVAKGGALVFTMGARPARTL